ncbi:MAG: hypothetical protein IPG50_12870 [Myxococcales bacterium]|nr:hypothetical protein [Myxococcales bacterium]
MPLAEAGVVDAPAEVEAAAPGSFDVTFGDGGLLVLDMVGRAVSIDVRPSQHLVIAGDVEGQDGGYPAVLQTDQHGNPDVSFGDSGVVTFSESRQAAAAARGSLAETWMLTRPASGEDSGIGYVTHLTPNGIDDRGSFQISPTTCPIVVPYDLAMWFTRADIVGVCALGPPPQPSVSVLDLIVYGFGTTHGSGFRGPLTPNVDGGFRYSLADAIGHQSAGDIIVAGVTWLDGDADGELTLVRLAHVDYDPSFGTNAVAAPAVGRARFGETALAIAPDDAIFVAFVRTSITGQSGPDASAAENRIAVAKLSANGQLDTTFGASGLALGPAAQGTTSLGNVQRRPDGKLVVAGSLDERTDAGGPLGGNKRMFVYQFDANGSLDTAFGSDGAVYSTGPRDEGREIAITPTGKLVVAGSVEQPTARWAVWQLNP